MTYRGRRWTGRERESEGSVPPIFNRVTATLFVILYSTLSSFYALYTQLWLLCTSHANNGSCDHLWCVVIVKIEQFALALCTCVMNTKLCLCWGTIIIYDKVLLSVRIPDSAYCLPVAMVTLWSLVGLFTRTIAWYSWLMLFMYTYSMQTHTHTHMNTHPHTHTNTHTHTHIQTRTRSQLPRDPMLLRKPYSHSHYGGSALALS